MLVSPEHLIRGAKESSLALICPVGFAIAFWLIACLAGVPRKFCEISLLLFAGVAAVVSFGITGQWFFVPERRRWRGAALAAYSLPLQFTAMWMYARLPVSYFAVAHVFLISACLLMLIAISRVLRKHATASRRRTVAMLSSWFVGVFCIAMIPPGLVTLDGLLRLTQFHTVRLAKGNHQTAGTDRPAFVHLSDTHFTGSATGRTYEGERGGEQLFETYREQILRLRPALVIHTGDVTDAGTHEQWLSAKQMLQPLGSAIPLIITPGNHDLSTAYAQADNDSEGRETDFLELQVSLNADAEASDGRRLGEVIKQAMPTRDEVEKRQQEMLRTLEELSRSNSIEFGVSTYGAAQKAAEKQLEPETIRRELLGHHIAAQWSDLFPMRWTSKDAQTFVLVLNSSVPPQDDQGRSALGAFGQPQLKRLSALVAGALVDGRVRTIVLCTHHPVARPISLETSFSTLFYCGLLRCNPAESATIIDLVTEGRATHPEIDWLVLYGHRHESYLGTLEGVWMVESPSLEPVGDSRRGFWAGRRAGQRLSIRWIPVD